MSQTLHITPHARVRAASRFGLRTDAAIRAYVNAAIRRMDDAEDRPDTDSIIFRCGPLRLVLAPCEAPCRLVTMYHSARYEGDVA